MKRHSGSTRRGTVLVAVLVCMGFATIVLLGAVQNSLHQRRQLRLELQMEQTRWLLDAGLSTGLARLQAKPDYDGETLTVTPALDNYDNASVEIAVIRDVETKKPVRLRATAQLGTSNENIPKMKRSQEIVVDNSQTNPPT
jgi:type II secretory pathway component PulK